MNILFIGTAAGKDGGSAARVRKMDGVVVEEADILFDAERLLQRMDEVILVIGSKIPLHDATAFVNRVTMGRDDVVGILEASAVTPELMHEALRGGFRDVIAEGAGDIEAAVMDAGALLRMSTGAATSKAGSRAGRGPGRVVSFLSPKGGVGKTVLSTNIAVGIARSGGGRVILLDLNRQFGDVGVFMGIAPDVDANDFSNMMDRLDEDLLDGLLHRHDSGVEVLLAPSRMDFTQRMTEEQMARLLRTAQGMADFVIVDTAPVLDPNVRTLLEYSDGVFLVANLDVPAVKNTRLMLQTLQALSYPDHRVKVVLNRANSDVALSPSEVERHLRTQIAVHVPSHGSVPRSVNEGDPILCHYPEAIGTRFLNRSRRRVAEALMTAVRLTLDMQPKSDVRPEADAAAGGSAPSVRVKGQAL